jgi:hypothetical protein
VKHPSDIANSLLRKHAADPLRRARKLPVGPHRNDLRQLAMGLLWLEKNNPRGSVQGRETAKGNKRYARVSCLLAAQHGVLMTILTCREFELLIGLRTRWGWLFQRELERLVNENDSEFPAEPTPALNGQTPFYSAARQIRVEILLH